MLTPNSSLVTTSLAANLAQVRQIILDKLNGYTVQIYLFGSQAQGTARLTSDIDVAIWPQESLPPNLLAEIREALFESTIPVAVDLVDLSQVDNNFQQRILQEAIVWTD